MAKRAAKKARPAMPGAGRPTRYHGKGRPRPYAVTPEAEQAIAEHARRVEASQGDLITHLALRYAGKVRESDLPPMTKNER